MRRPWLVALLLASLFMHLVGLSHPRKVVFDEVHFGEFVSYYTGSHERFFDIHPPHGKLFVAGPASALGYRGEQSFEHIDDPITEVAPWKLRVAPAVAGSLLPALLAILALQLGAGEVGAFLVGLAALLDPALLVQTRIIAIDGFLLAGILGCLSALLAARAAHGARRLGWAAVAGLAAGVAVGTKFTGLVVVGLAGLVLLLDTVRDRSPRRLLTIAPVALLVAAAVYVAGWAVHVHLLTEPGPGDAWGKPTGDAVADVLKLHRQMLTANSGIRTEHPYSSFWYAWPFGYKPMSYWTSGQQNIQLTGNPVLWIGTAVGMPALLFLLIRDRLRGATRIGDAWIPWVGWLAAWLPLATVHRPLFLYHYLPSLLFAVLGTGVQLDRLRRVEGRWRGHRGPHPALVLPLLIGFLLLVPTAYGLALPTWLTDLVRSLQGLLPAG